MGITNLSPWFTFGPVILTTIHSSILYEHDPLNQSRNLTHKNKVTEARFSKEMGSLG